MTPPVILGPMAGVSDLPFRTLCREQGCGLVCTEMVSAKAMFYGNKGTDLLLQTIPEEHPAAVQLFGSDPGLMADMAKRLEEQPFDLIDINMGCPVPKVVNNHEGSALMKDPELAGRIIRSVSSAVKKPVTVKIRAGWNEALKNAVEIAKAAEANGAAAVTVHGRTREQYYAGKADWDIIRQVKEAVTIPVIGNGDVRDAESAAAMFLRTGCDGIMVARAARGNPWIFREIQAALSGQDVPPAPSFPERREMILRHARMQISLFGEHMGMLQMRKQVAWYTAGCPHSSDLRRAVNQVECLEDLKKLLTEYERISIIL